MTWFDTISKKREKGMRKLEEALLVEGYKIVETGNPRRGKHTKIKVKRLSEVDDPNAEVVQTTVSHAVTQGRKNAAMVVNEIINKFIGRKRRGQGSFKLSNDKINTWQSILKIEPKNNPLSDEFEIPEIPALDRIKLNPKGKPGRLLANFPIAKKLFEIKESKDYSNILRVEGSYWIYDNSYFALAFKTKNVTSIINKHDLESTSGDIDLFLDAVLEFYLTIDSNYEERSSALEIYSTNVFEFLLQEYKGDSKEKTLLEGTISEGMRILESFEGKVKPIEIVIQQTVEDIKEGDTEINWETLSQHIDFDLLDEAERKEFDEGDEGARQMFMTPEDYAESITEEELRRRRNRG